MCSAARVPRQLHRRHMSPTRKRQPAAKHPAPPCTRSFKRPKPDAQQAAACARSKAEHSGARVQLQMRAIPTGAAAENLRRNSAMRAGTQRKAHCAAPKLRRYAATSDELHLMAHLRGDSPLLQRRAWVCEQRGKRARASQSSHPVLALTSALDWTRNSAT